MAKTNLMPKVKPKRTYDNAARAGSSEENRSQIIQTLVSLLVEKKGGEVPISDIAKRSKISERTIFRFFKDKQALYEATSLYVAQYVQSSVKQLSQTDLVSFARHLFNQFEANQDLMIAYLVSPFGQQTRQILRKQFNTVLQTAARKHQVISKNRKSDARLALIVSMMSARTWYELKSDFDVSGKDSTEALAWAVETLLKNI